MTDETPQPHPPSHPQLQPEAQPEPQRRRASRPVADAPVRAAGGVQTTAGADRSPAWPAQYDTDGWDQIPVQMRP